jgi:hypothetical protein
MGQMVVTENSFISFVKKLKLSKKIMIICPTHGQKAISEKQHRTGIRCYKCHHLAKRPTCHNWFTD